MGWRRVPIDQLVSLVRLREVLDYDPNAGTFTWRKRLSAYAPGAVAGCSSGKDGYIQINIDCRAYLAHRLAWFYTHGEWPAEAVDHIDGDGANNRLSNLRLATPLQNQMNKRRHRKTTAGLKGVARNRHGGKWSARIRVEGRRLTVGSFDTPEEAHAAYVAAARYYYGDYANAG
jgi:hypothetical protein